MKQKVIKAKVSNLNIGGGNERVTVTEMPPKELKEHDHFHGQSISFSNKKGDPMYRVFEDEQIVEIVVREVAK